MSPRNGPKNGPPKPINTQKQSQLAGQAIIHYVFHLEAADFSASYIGLPECIP